VWAGRSKARSRARRRQPAFGAPAASDACLNSAIIEYALAKLSEISRQTIMYDFLQCCSSVVIIFVYVSLAFALAGLARGMVLPGEEVYFTWDFDN